jgi:hypothetical protein
LDSTGVERTIGEFQSTPPVAGGRCTFQR